VVHEYLVEFPADVDAKELAEKYRFKLVSQGGNVHLVSLSRPSPFRSFILSSYFSCVFLALNFFFFPICLLFQLRGSADSDLEGLKTEATSVAPNRIIGNQNMPKLRSPHKVGGADHLNKKNQ
jgi:hypothetical protein